MSAAFVFFLTFDLFCVPLHQLTALFRNNVHFRLFFLDRVHSSIVRQPSDRRLDANISIRSNGNTSSSTSVLNSSDLQNSFHATSNANESATSSGGFVGVSDLTISSGSTTLSNCLTGGTGMTSISDLNAPESADSKDARRETYVVL